MEHKVWYDADNEMIRICFEGEYLTADVPKIKEKLIEFGSGKERRQLVIELSNAAKVESRETRELSNQAMKEAQIEHVAFIGGSAANRMIAKVLLKTGALKTQGNFFKNLDEGINWLKSIR